MTCPTQLRYVIGALALALSLSGCGDDEPSGADESPPSTQDSSPSTTSAGVLDFETVESLTAPRFETDRNCAFGVWSENSTGIAEEYRASATTIQQFDCYRNEDSAAFGMPKRLQQSVFVEFEDSAAADAFAEDQYYARLVADTVVVLAGTGLDESVDMVAYLADLQDACGCGEVFASEY